MRTRLKLLLLFLMLLSLNLTPSIAQSQLTAIEQAQSSTHAAYKKILEAYKAGADPTTLTEQINQAINLTSQAQTLSTSNPQQALNLAAQAQKLADDLGLQASAAKEKASEILPIPTAIAIIALIAVGVLIYFYGPQTFWKIWLNLRKNYQVKTKSSANQAKTNNLIVTWEQVCAVCLGITIIIAFVVASQYFLPKGASEQFSELGVLGPNMKLGDYPSQIVANETVTLYVYVGNQMGRPMYYNVQVKLGDNSTSVDPAPIIPIQQFSRVVPSNGTWTFPLNAALTQPGLNQRLIFELWIYNETSNLNQYHDRWTDVWFNVTAQAS